MLFTDWFGFGRDARTWIPRLLIFAFVFSFASYFPIRCWKQVYRSGLKMPPKLLLGLRKRCWVGWSIHLAGATS